MTIASPHNETLKEVRKLAGRRWRDKLGEFVAEGEDLLAAADAAPLLLRQLRDAAQQVGQLGLATEQAHANLLERGGARGGGDRRLALAPQLVDAVGHGRAILRLAS